MTVLRAVSSDLREIQWTVRLSDNLGGRPAFIDSPFQILRIRVRQLRIFHQLSRSTARRSIIADVPGPVSHSLTSPPSVLFFPKPSGEGCWKHKTCSACGHCRSEAWNCMFRKRLVSSESLSSVDVGIYRHGTRLRFPITGYRTRRNRDKKDRKTQRETRWIFVCPKPDVADTTYDDKYLTYGRNLLLFRRRMKFSRLRRAKQSSRTSPAPNPRTGVGHKERERGDSDPMQ